ncbi:hypothetical protein B0H14DRAFT_2620690 [Mycena olivaceomarginata]|nr:hypothetical protein B0H14DRAFT_2620690 [Mycena olivaceomarginata]
MQLKLGVNLSSNFASDDVDIEARAAARRILSTPSSHPLPTRRGVRSAIHLVLIRLAGASGTRLSDTQRYRVYPPSKPDYSSPSPSANPIRLCPCSAPPSRNLMQMYGYGYLPKLANGILDSGGVLSYLQSVIHLVALIIVALIRNAGAAASANAIWRYMSTSYSGLRTCGQTEARSAATRTELGSDGALRPGTKEALIFEGTHRGDARNDRGHNIPTYDAAMQFNFEKTLVPIVCQGTYLGNN